MEAEEAVGIFTIFVDSVGEVAFQETRNDAAIAAIIEARDAYCADVECDTQPATVFLRADGALPATALAGLIGRLAAAGFTDLHLVTAAAEGTQ
jgi:biopolymer transport protein ExbD